MEKAPDTVEKGMGREESVPTETETGWPEWLMLAAAAAPWLGLGWVLDNARNPSRMKFGFSGYISNPTAGQKGGGIFFGPPSITLDTATVNLVTGPRSINIQGNVWIPYEFVSLQNDGSQFDTVQVQPNGNFTYTFTPDVNTFPGDHTLRAVGLDDGANAIAKWKFIPAIMP
jgi:hypothetical protein